MNLIDEVLRLARRDEGDDALNAELVAHATGRTRPPETPQTDPRRRWKS